MEPPSRLGADRHVPVQLPRRVAARAAPRGRARLVALAAEHRLAGRRHADPRGARRLLVLRVRLPRAALEPARRQRLRGVLRAARLPAQPDLRRPRARVHDAAHGSLRRDRPARRASRSTSRASVPTGTTRDSARTSATLIDPDAEVLDADPRAAEAHPRDADARAPRDARARGPARSTCRSAASRCSSASTSSCSPGETVALLGNNGAGKTTTLRTLAGLQTRRRRHACASTASTSPKLTPAGRAELGMSLVIGGRAVFGPLTVDENLRMFGARLEDTRPSSTSGSTGSRPFPWIARPVRSARVDALRRRAADARRRRRRSSSSRASC